MKKIKEFEEKLSNPDFLKEEVGYHDDDIEDIIERIREDHSPTKALLQDVRDALRDEKIKRFEERKEYFHLGQYDGLFGVNRKENK